MGPTQWGLCSKKNKLLWADASCASRRKDSGEEGWGGKNYKTQPCASVLCEFFFKYAVGSIQMFPWCSVYNYGHENSL